MDDRETIQVQSNRVAAGVRWRLLMVGFAFHAPGLRLFFGRAVPAAARRENFVAIVCTLISVATTAWVNGNWMWVAVVWVVAHFTWGARLAWHLSQDI